MIGAVLSEPALLTNEESARAGNILVSCARNATGTGTQNYDAQEIIQFIGLGGWAWNGAPGWQIVGANLLLVLPGWKAPIRRFGGLEKSNLTSVSGWCGAS